jgi:hypothetical protein
LEFEETEHKRRNETHEKVKEARIKSQGSSDNSNGSQEREKP